MSLVLRSNYHILFAAIFAGLLIVACQGKKTPTTEASTPIVEEVISEEFPVQLTSTLTNKTEDNDTFIESSQRIYGNLLTINIIDFFDQKSLNLYKNQDLIKNGYIVNSSPSVFPFVIPTSEHYEDAKISIDENYKFPIEDFICINCNELSPFTQYENVFIKSDLLTFNNKVKNKIINHKDPENVIAGKKFQMKKKYEITSYDISNKCDDLGKSSAFISSINFVNNLYLDIEVSKNSVLSDINKYRRAVEEVKNAFANNKNISKQTFEYLSENNIHLNLNIVSKGYMDDLLTLISHTEITACNLTNIPACVVLFNKIFSEVTSQKISNDSKYPLFYDRGYSIEKFSLQHISK